MTKRFFDDECFLKEIDNSDDNVAKLYIFSPYDKDAKNYP